MILEAKRQHETESIKAVFCTGVRNHFGLLTECKDYKSFLAVSGRLAMKAFPFSSSDLLSALTQSSHSELSDICFQMTTFVTDVFMFIYKIAVLDGVVADVV